jgi:hypothetical protein
VFGNNIANTQVLTGSVTVTGSLAVVTNGTEFQVTSTGVNLGNALTDTHNITGSLRVTGSITSQGGFIVGNSHTIAPTGSIGYNNAIGVFIYGKSGSEADFRLYNRDGLTAMSVIAGTQNVSFNGNLGINGSPGTAFPLEAYINSSTAYSSTSRGNVMRVYNSNASSNVFAGIELGGAGPSNDGLAGLNGVVTSAGSAALTFYTRDSNTFSEKMRISSGGYVGIGTTSPKTILNVQIGTASSYSGGGAGEAIRVSTGNTNAWMSCEYNGITAYYGATTSNIVKFAGYNYSAGSSIDMEIGQSAMYVKANNYIGIGTSSPAGRLQVNGAGGSEISFQLNDSASRRVFCVPSQYYGYIFAISVATDGGKGISFGNGGGATEVGSIVCNNASTTYNTTSDYRLKEDLKDFNGLNKISAIKVYDFKWKSNEERTNGVLAHELAEVLPYAVHGEKDGLDRDGNPSYQGVDYSKIVPSLVKAIQELNTKFEEYKATHP